jgi:anti-sigma B factor antagonist
MTSQIGCKRTKTLAKQPDPGAEALNMQISTRQLGDVTVVDVTGDITLYHSPDLRKTLLDLIKTQKIVYVVVNLTNVKYIDSAGVASLIEGLKASRDMKSRFSLFGLSRVAREVLELTRLLKVFEVYENETQALESKPANP